MRAPEPCYGESDSTGGVTLYSIRILIQLSADLPVEDVPVSALERQLHEERWADDDHRPLRPIDAFSGSHWEQALRTDLSFPIILAPNGTVADGYHRLLRAYRENKKTILVRMLNQLPREAVVAPIP